MKLTPKHRIHLLGDLFAKRGIKKGHEVAANLAGAGFSTVGKVRKADDKVLRQIPGVGPKCLEQLREVIGRAA